MNQRTKIIISILLAVLIVLVLALANFYLGTTKIDGSASGTTSELSNYRIYADETSGLFGLSDAESRVIIEPTWNRLQFVSDDTLLAGKSIDGTICYGMLDVEETVLVPLVYQSLTELTDEILIGRLAADDTSVLYTTDGARIFSTAWDTCTMKNKEFTMTRGENIYTALLLNGTVHMNTITLMSHILGQDVPVRVTAGTISVAPDFMIFEEVAALSGQYMEALLSDDMTAIYTVTSSDSYNAVIQSRYFTDCTLDEITMTDVTLDTSGAAVKYSCTYIVQYFTGDITQLPDDAVPETDTVVVTMCNGVDGYLLLTNVTSDKLAAQTQMPAPEQ